MVLSLVNRYFNWLQEGNPVGQVERYPELRENFESSQKNLYIAGDLTGIPLLKYAAESGAKIVKTLAPSLKAETSSRPESYYDIIIIGAGPAGISAALECQSENLKYLVLEATQIFNTLAHFPKGKPILAKPDDFTPESQLPIRDGTKESLLEDLNQALQNKNLSIQNGAQVKKITALKDGLNIETSDKAYAARKIILAIGKSGNSRQLHVPGESLPKVFNKLYDPGEFEGRQILVVGGGDTALEASVALAQAGNQVTHSYRRDKFSRPKPENLEAFDRLVATGAITPLWNSAVKSIGEKSVQMEVNGSTKNIDNHVVYTLIGRELPLQFFKRSGIALEGEKTFRYYVFLTAMVSFFTMLYFGKSGLARPLLGEGTFWGYLLGPFQGTYSWGLKSAGWYGSLNFLLGWVGSLIWLGSGTLAFFLMVRHRAHYFGTPWHRLKYGYFIGVAAFFTWVYFEYQLNRNAGWVYEPTYYYSLFYCITMLIFGIRRMQTKKTRYIRYQMITLISIQVFFLFLLPYHLYDTLIAPNFAKDSFLLSEMFPQGKWSSFGFILFWPLNISNFGTSTFWTWFPFVQTFGLLSFLVYKFGKGAYCGWICSCGGMAETLGDEYRHLAPHGPHAKKWENLGQIILLWITVATVIHYTHTHLGWGSQILSDTIWGLYKISIDVFFAGVLGLGVYFFLGGRVWCRYGCPLAALMHIYNRFSVYRILSEKKKCISCNMCTKVCHMGIDVMNFANKGIPLNDAECVRCSACVQTCPTDVLSFGSVNSSDPKNRARLEFPSYGKDSWKAGLH